MIKRSLITGFAASSILLSAVCCYAGTFTAFGPKTFVRGSGSPVVETASFSVNNTGAAYTLRLYNGGVNNEYERVSSAVIKLNGSTVFEEKDFNKQVSQLQKQVSLSTSNQLEVELRSAPGSAVTINIEGVDDTPPAVDVSSPADNAYLNTPTITVTGTTSDSISWVNTVTVNGVSAAISGESYSLGLELSEGSNTITATATDAAGNTENSSIAVVLDTAPPKVTLNAVKTITNNPQLTLTGKIEDANPVSLVVNGTSVNISNNTFSTTVTLTEGNNDVIVTATDKAGNVGTASTNLFLDTTPPTGSTFINNGATYANKTSVTLTFTCNDSGSGCGQIQFSSDDIDWTAPETYSASKAWTLTSGDGSKTVYVKFADNAGNQSDSYSATITLDATPPAFTSTTPASNSFINTSIIGYTLSEAVTAGSITFIWTGGNADSNSPLVYTMTGDDLAAGGHTINTNLHLVDGAIYTISFDATDFAGNVATTVSNAVVNYDVTAPAISISSPENGSSVSTETVAVTGTVDDNAATVAVNGISATVSNNTFTAPELTLIEGTNQIIATATDQVGNKSTATIKITRIIKDTTPPVIKILSPSEGYTSEYQEIEVLGTIDDDSATVTVNGATAKFFKKGTDNYFTASGIKLVAGVNTITVTAVDGAGNTGIATITVTYTGITIQSPLDGSIVNYPSLEVWGMVADNITNITVNGIPAKVSSNTFSASLTLIEGPNTITVSAYDMAGNMITTSITVTYQYTDTTAPAISITSPSSGSTLTNKTITVTGAIDDTTAIVSVNGINASVSNNTFTASNISLTEGTNTISVTAADTAGNTSSSSITVNLDTVAPTVLSTTPSNNATDVSLDSNITVYFSEAIDSSTVTTSNITLSGAAENVSGYLNQSGNTVSFVPLNKLSYETTYTATIKGGSGGIKDTVGNAMQQDYIWTFKTKDEPPIMIEITEPQDGTTINKSTTIIKGTIKAQSTDFGITVNGVIAEINGENWTATIPLQVGTNSIAATATDTAGNTATQTITINTASTQQYVTITTNPTSGIAPLNTTFNIGTSISNTVTSYKIDFDGDSVTDLETTTTSGITHTYDTPGIYYPTVTVTDSQGNTYTETTAINVLSKEEMDALLKGKWEGMKGAMASSNIETAIGYFTEASKERYQGIFTKLKDNLPTIAAEMSDIQLIYVKNGKAKYRIRRQEADGEMTYYIYFVKDGSGLWKIYQY